MTESRRLDMAEFDYALPDELIAQEPYPERDTSRLLVLDRQGATIAHRHFRDLPDLLVPGDLLVVNDSRVIPARLSARKPTGGRVELLLLQPTADGRWEALARSSRRIPIGVALSVQARAEVGGEERAAWVTDVLGEGRVLVRLEPTVEQELDRYGTVPLPPYIRTRLSDDEQYQTVFNAVPGSAAAPTAGLHFSLPLIDELKRRGVAFAHVTLHIGLATFRPVTARFADEHDIHREWCSVETEAAAAIVQARRERRRVIAVGTTAARTLETFGQRLERGDERPFSAMTDLFIVPGYRWRVVNAMVTNFHVPRSTLLLMVSALASRELILSAYAQAIRQKYRFLSFGDAMLIV